MSDGPELIAKSIPAVLAGAADMAQIRRLAEAEDLVLKLAIGIRSLTDETCGEVTDAILAGFLRIREQFEGMPKRRESRIVEAQVESLTLEVTDGNKVRRIPSVKATCERCQHSVESFGNGEASVKRCMVLLRLECPGNDRNFYRAAP